MNIKISENEFVQKHKTTIQSWLGAVVLCFLIIATIIMAYKPWEYSLYEPIRYYGTDEVSMMAEIKAIGTEGTVVNNSQQGMPFGTERQSVMSYYLFNDAHVIGGLIYKITGEVGLSANLAYFIFIILNGICAYIALRCMKIRLGFSICAAWVYSALYYVYWRNIMHLMLSAYYCVPLTILICYWLITDESFFCYGRSFWKNKRNIAAIIIAFMIVNNGVGYYPFFSCFFIIVTGVYAGVSKGKFKNCLRAFAVVLQIMLSYLVVLIPYISSVMKYGKLKTAISHLPIEAEEFALKITKLFMPVRDTGISYIDTLVKSYNESAPFQTEASEYLGVLAIIGFIVLVFVFLRGNKVNNDILSMLTVLLVAGIMLSVFGGFGMIFNLFVTGTVRCYNRISVFLAFICLTGLGVYVTEVVSRIKVANAVYLVLIIPVTLLSVRCQIPETRFFMDYENSFNSDKNFVENIEDVAEEGSRIFQLPYHSYPEGGMEVNMEQDRLFVGYLFSKDLSWTYGAYKGSRSDKWCKKVSAYDTKKLLDTIIYMDFKGIYIEKNGYTEENAGLLLNSLTDLLGQQPLVSDNGLLYYYDLKDYYNNAKATQTEEEWNSNVERVSKIGQ